MCSWQAYQHCQYLHEILACKSNHPDLWRQAHCQHWLDTSGHILHSLDSACTVFVGRAHTTILPKQSTSQQGKCRRTVGCYPETLWLSSVGESLLVPCPGSRIPPGKRCTHHSHLHRVQPCFGCRFCMVLLRLAPP